MQNRLKETVAKNSATDFYNPWFDETCQKNGYFDTFDGGQDFTWEQPNHAMKNDGHATIDYNNLPYFDLVNTTPDVNSIFSFDRSDSAHPLVVDQDQIKHNNSDANDQHCSSANKEITNLPFASATMNFKNEHLQTETTESDIRELLDFLSPLRLILFDSFNLYFEIHKHSLH
ncbi:hypothetical protein RFI_30445 [Reticulomyxa filosa]|uniref:Uncharacterized protein n=1 Tax=Reticulomyxa filosa TaxID=46433 RepID=X6LYG2_RETFI|nr:hypothetical protein RFI_30445 [Reticulomyxa filosa]|eukprot:ETO06948.1 hypothetical protein RFI_30445 [Reticulomyxa filosa]